MAATGAAEAFSVCSQKKIPSVLSFVSLAAPTCDYRQQTGESQVRFL